MNPQVSTYVTVQQISKFNVLDLLTTSLTKNIFFAQSIG